MCSHPVPQAAPTQGAAPTATRAHLLALIDQCHAQAAQRRSSYPVAPPLSPEQQYEPSTDPTRWQGFI
jgi:hypothetical protein